MCSRPRGHASCSTAWRHSGPFMARPIMRSADRAGAAFAGSFPPSERLAIGVFGHRGNRHRDLGRISRLRVFQIG